MKVALNVNSALWLELPRFEAESPSALEWEDRVISGMRDAWRGKLTTEIEPYVREALRNGLRHVREEDAVALQFWPGASIANAIVHIGAAPFEADESRELPQFADDAYAAKPVVELREAPGLGYGIETRYLTKVGDEAPVRLGGIDYIFRNDFGFVAVSVEPTIPDLIGILLEPLRDLVDGIRVIDDPEGYWTPATVDETVVPARGESWPKFDNADESGATIS